MSDIERFKDGVVQHARVEAMCGLANGVNTLTPIRPMTKAAFVAWYIGKQGLTEERYHRLYVAIPCNCDERSCKGWATVSNRPEAIVQHVRECLERDEDWYVKLVDWSGELW